VQHNIYNKLKENDLQDVLTVSGDGGEALEAEKVHTKHHRHRTEERMIDLDEVEVKQEKPSFFRRVFGPHDESMGRIYRCQCGALYTEAAYSDAKFIRGHSGHRVTPAIGGTFWEFLKIKMGWIP
jgi:DNA-directed RNA polymerase subunit M/transcription elongation factor TFIIS